MAKISTLTDYMDTEETYSGDWSIKAGKLPVTSGLTALPVEIIEMVADYLSLEDLKNTRTCCSALAYLAFSAVFSRSKLVIPLCEQGSRDLLTITRRGIGRHVRYMAFVECNHTQRHRGSALEPPESSRMCLALRKMAKVVQLEWSSGDYLSPERHQFTPTIQGENILSIYFNFTGQLRRLEIDAFSIDCRGFARTICACDNLRHLTIRQWNSEEGDRWDSIWDQSMAQMLFRADHFEHMRSLKIERNKLCLDQLMPLLEGLQQTLVKVQLICSSLKANAENVRKLFNLTGDNPKLENFVLWRRPYQPGASAIVLSREQFVAKRWDTQASIVQGFGMGDDTQYNLVDIRKNNQITWALWTGSN